MPADYLPALFCEKLYFLNRFRIKNYYLNIANENTLLYLLLKSVCDRISVRVSGLGHSGRNVYLVGIIYIQPTSGKSRRDWKWCVNDF